jgi:acetaldehyde dehydrogenase (acetylating)
VGGAAQGKAIIVLNPAEPPLLMRDTVMCEVDGDADREAIAHSVHDMVEEVASYVPGYRLTAEPQFHGERVTVLLEIEGAGDFLERYSGNLDIMTAAAARVGDELARHMNGVAA